MTLDLYPVDHWYDVVSGAITAKDWSWNGIMTKGSVAFNQAEGIFTIEGNGAGIDEDERDQAYYIYKEVTGDYSLSARVPLIETTEVSSYEEHAGLMIRDNLSVGSKNVYTGFTPETDRDPGTDVNDGTFKFKYRDVEDTDPSENTVERLNTYQATAEWLKISRKGNQYNGYYSIDGSDSSWQNDSGSYTTTLDKVGNIIANKAMIGMAVSSYNTIPDYMYISDGLGICGLDTCFYKCRVDHTSDESNRPLPIETKYTDYAGNKYSFKAKKTIW